MILLWHEHGGTWEDFISNDLEIMLKLFDIIEIKNKIQNDNLKKKPKK